MSPTIIHLRDLRSRPGVLTLWEKARHSSAHPLVECFAEFLGVFIYTYCGVGSTAAYVLGNILELPGVSSLLQIGFAYGFGIVFAITLVSATSGSHINPCITILQVLLKGFPPLKGLRYIIAQILGAYVACLLIYVQYHDLIVTAEALLLETNKMAIMFTPQGPAGIFGLYVLPGSNLGRVFLNEFLTDTLLALVIFTCLDPTNILIPPAAGPFVIGFAYAMAIWGFAAVGLAANSARDIGGRLTVLTLYGKEASGGSYAAIAALTNIPATLFGYILYEVFLVDSDRVVAQSHLEHIHMHKYHARTGEATDHASDMSSEKPSAQMIERA